VIINVINFPAVGFMYKIYKIRCTRLATASDKGYQLLAHSRWFYPGTPASSTTKTGRHDIAEILLKVAFKKHLKSSQNQNQYQYRLLHGIFHIILFIIPSS
jgi:hypothetical protein